MPSRNIPMSQLTFRMPEALHEHLEQAAEAHHRSLNAEVIARLEASFATDDQGLILGDNPVAMEARMKRMEELAEQSTTSTDA